MYVWVSSQHTVTATTTHRDTDYFSFSRFLFFSLHVWNLFLFVFKNNIIKLLLFGYYPLLSNFSTHITPLVYVSKPCVQNPNKMSSFVPQDTEPSVVQIPAFLTTEAEVRLMCAATGVDLGGVGSYSNAGACKNSHFPCYLLFTIWFVLCSLVHLFFTCSLCSFWRKSTCENHTSQ